MKVCYIDAETTGLDCKDNGMVQLAGSICELGGEELISFNYDIKTFPDDKIDQKALEVTGLTEEIISLYPSPTVIYGKFISLLGKFVDRYDRTDKLFFIGYNARFDYDFCRAWFEKCGDSYFGSWFFFPPIDVMNLAIVRLMHQRKSLKNFKLGTVTEHFNLKVEGQLHDADVDIKLTRMLYEKLIEDLNVH